MHVFAEEQSLNETLNVNIDLEHKVFQLFIREREKHILIVVSQMLKVRVLRLNRNLTVHLIHLIREETLSNHIKLGPRSNVCVSLARINSFAQSMIEILSFRRSFLRRQFA